MSLSKIFKKVLIPCAAGVANADTEGHTYGSNCVKKSNQGTKPSDLPIYPKECIVCREANQIPPPPGGMEETVGNIRRELWVWQDNLKGYRHKIIDVYRKGFSKIDFIVDYLREPAHGPHRMGAVALSGLAGYILGMRRGRIRRIVNGTLGMTAMAAICYPEEAKDCLESVVLETRRYFIIAYHFICGESPQMPDWLEKFVGAKEIETNEKKLDSKTAILSEETKPAKEKKA